MAERTSYPSIDKPWMRYYEQCSFESELRDESLFQMLERRSASRLEETALMLLPEAGFEPGRVNISYGEYLARIRECARALKALGVGKDEIVGTLLPNVPESRIAIYALNMVGATAYPLSPTLPPSQLGSILSSAGISRVICFVGFLEKLGTTLPELNLDALVLVRGDESLAYGENHLPAGESMRISADFVSEIPNAMTWEEMIGMASNHPEEVTPYYHRGHVAAIIGTSGTTGTPKGVCLTDENLNALAVGQEVSNHYRAGEKALDALMQFVGYGISTAHALSVIGCHTVLCPQLITNALPRVLSVVQPDIFPGGPVHYINLARSEEFRNGEIPPARALYSGGASLDAKVESALNGVGEGYEERPGDNIYARQGYGSTECCGAATACASLAYKFGSIGIPMATLTLGIFKPGTDEELPYNTVGEICVTGPSVMDGYLNNPEETEKVLRHHSDGRVWLHQADLGWCDESGHFFLTDRIKNIFMRMGFNIFPSKIAERIAAIEGVERCAVAGVSHPEEVAVPVAFVVSDVKHDDMALREAIVSACYADLDEFYVPYDVVFVDDFPVNVGGKIDNEALIHLSGIDYENHPEPYGVKRIDE